MEFEYRPRGVCSNRIVFDLEDGVVRNVRVIGGCDGNSQGIANLVEGMDVDEVIRRTRGIRCGRKETSCPDQLSKALIAAKEKQAAEKKAAVKKA